MATGLGLSIGTVNAVSALTGTPEGAGRGRRRRPDPSFVTTHRTSLVFDSTGLARLGTIPPHGRVITEFADLGRPETKGARIGNHALRPADLVAVVTDCLISDARRDPRGDDAEVVLAHPIGYGPELVAMLRSALDWAGLERVRLVSEPVAAAAWLEAEYGPLMPGLALVYDLGGATVDITLVRVGGGSPDDPVIGTPLRSRAFGGRAFGALVAERSWGGRAAGDEVSSDSVSTDALRVDHVRGSLDLVYRCLRSADVTMADVDRILVVGGASRPAQVARVLSDELARPVVTTPDPECVVALGASVLARREREAAAEEPLRMRSLSRLARRRRAAVLAGSSVAVAVAATMSADTVWADTVWAGLPLLGAG